MRAARYACIKDPSARQPRARRGPQVNRTNFGLTLDSGHALMAGENPAQGVALVAAAGKLFGVHLNDGHSRLGAEDG
jgi:sugar phosphate isomerase/epimerase